MRAGPVFFAVAAIKEAQDETLRLDGYLRGIDPRSGCEMCSHPRPKDYKIPENYVMSKEEIERLQREEEDDRKAQRVCFVLLYIVFTVNALCRGTIFRGFQRLENSTHENQN